MGVEIRIVDDDDIPLPPGQPGEILLRSSRAWGAASGYWKMPEVTLEATRNLWFHTGDRGILDTEGYLWFVDRKKDSIRRRGENISAYEVEQIVARHPAVAEAAAFAVPAETSEDEVAVSIILKPGMRLSEAELLQHCIANMSYFMVPRFIRFVAEFPRTPSQKVEKHRLKSAAAADRSCFWDRVAHGIEVKR
jgi:crotonobetaine/carnitine-CoA ligase